MPGPSTDELVRRYRAGEFCAAIAAAIGSRPTTVPMRLRRAGVKLRLPGRPASRGLLGARDADLVARYLAGETCAEIAAATGLSRSTVHTRLKRAGVQLRPSGTAPRYGRLDLPVAEIIERSRAGESTCAIGSSLGVSAQAIRQRLIAAGVERRPKGTHPRPPRRQKEQSARANDQGAKRRAIEEFLDRPETGEMTQHPAGDRGCRRGPSDLRLLDRRADEGSRPWSVSVPAGGSASAP
jgi:hypothetical protein